MLLTRKPGSLKSDEGNASHFPPLAENEDPEVQVPVNQAHEDLEVNQAQDVVQEVDVEVAVVCNKMMMTISVTANWMLASTGTPLPISSTSLLA